MGRKGGDTVDTSYQSAPSQTVVAAVAQAEGISVEELCPPEYQPLHDIIDPQALDELFMPKADGSLRGSGQVSFTFCGYDVTVESDGSVTLE
ncbi:HalOD1 output domain-containing protein [Natrialbaceae archaeon A-gly3]